MTYYDPHQMAESQFQAIADGAEKLRRARPELELSFKEAFQAIAHSQAQAKVTPATVQRTAPKRAAATPGPMTNAQARQIIAHTRASIARASASDDPKIRELCERLRQTLREIELLLIDDDGDDDEPKDKDNDTMATSFQLAERRKAGLTDAAARRHLHQLDRIMGLEGALLEAFGYEAPPAATTTVVNGVQTFHLPAPKGR